VAVAVVRLAFIQDRQVEVGAVPDIQLSAILLDQLHSLDSHKQFLVQAPLLPIVDLEVPVSLYQVQ